MSMAGFRARDVDASPGLLHLARGVLVGGVGEESVKTFASPVASPLAGAVITLGGKRPPAWACRPDGSFAVLDGEVYNLRELGPAPAAAADGGGTIAAPGAAAAGKLLDLCLAGGEEAMSRVDSGATLAVWDAPRETLLLFRDRFGIVPCFYAERPDGLIWASDIPTLLGMGAPRRIHLAALDFFLGNGFVPAPWTFVESINKLPPAHCLRVARGGRVELRRYWRPTGRPKLRLAAGEATRRLGELCEQSLLRRWPADGGKAGVLLSGGVDSKLIAALLHKALGSPFDTFTFRYAGYEGVWNELEPARRIAEHCGTRHHEILFRPSDIAENLETMVRSHGEPFTYGLHSFMLRDIAAAGVETLLNGAGPDGWYLNRRNVQGLWCARLPYPLRLAGRAATASLRFLNCRERPLCLWRVYEAAGRLADDAEVVAWCARTGLPLSMSGVILPEAFRAGFYLDPGWVPEAREAAADLFRTAARDHAGESGRDRITFLHRQFKNAEGILYWNHWWGRAHGLNVRFPYFDGDLMDFVLRLPRKGHDKDEVRRLAAALMPHAMAYSPKIPQTVPIRHWFRGPLRDFLQEQLAPARIRASGLFSPGAVEKCIHQHLQEGLDNGWKLWALLAVVVWQDIILRGAPAPGGQPLADGAADRPASEAGSADGLQHTSRRI